MGRRGGLDDKEGRRLGKGEIKSNSKKALLDSVKLQIEHLKGKTKRAERRERRNSPGNLHQRIGRWEERYVRVTLGTRSDGKDGGYMGEWDISLCGQGR